MQPARTKTTKIVAAGAACVLIALASVVLAKRAGQVAPPPPRLVPDDAVFFGDPNTEAKRWVDSHPDDSRGPEINSEIVRHPQAIWFTSNDPHAITREVREIVTAASRQGVIPVLVTYVIPHRDCGGPSSGGAPDVAAYRRWIDNFAAGLGALPAWIILEPDALAEAGCLSANTRAARFEALAYAASTLRHSDPGVRLYYDAGHSGWQPVDTIAARLRMAGVNTYANGLALNVAGFDSTQREIAYGVRLVRALGNRSLRLVIDTGRNGSNPPVSHCDPPGRVLGARPTANTGNPWVDAFLWVKPPGESDGCLAGPGTFLPDYAYQLATARTTATQLTRAPVERGRRS
jgi:endoglucanase